MSEHCLVFVYGTLRQGEYNAPYLKGARFLGPCLSASAYTMWDLGAYPGVVPGGDAPVVGEVYQVDDETLAQLDVLEGYPHDYMRERIDTPYGAAWIYLLRDAERGDRPVVNSGDWCDYHGNRRFI